MIWQERGADLSACPTLQPLSDVNNQQQLGQKFTLLNWNIYKQQNLYWSEKLHQWSQQADLVTLQEVKYTPDIIQYSRQLNFTFLQNIAFYYQDHAFGVSTFSRMNPLQTCGSSDQEPWIRVPKVGLASTYALADSTSTLLLINLHGVNFTFTATPLYEQISPYLSLIKRHNGPVIVSGDLNTWTESKNKMIHDELVNKLGFKTVTHNPDYRKTAFGYPLDHILYRDLVVVNSVSLATEASDHTPQIVTFSHIFSQKKDSATTPLFE